MKWMNYKKYQIENKPVDEHSREYDGSENETEYSESE